MPEHADAGSVFASFFDDAAIFPPGEAPLDRAVREHVARRSTDLGSWIGPLLLTPDRLDEAARPFTDTGDAKPLRVGVVVPPARLDDTLSTIAKITPTVRVTGLEFKPADTGLDRLVAEAAALAEKFDVHLELPVQYVLAQGLNILEDTPVRLKVRTGGLDPRAFPSVDELAATIGTAVRTGVPFKLTAGLHRAIRYTDESTGFTHHGFLNIAMATAAALEGAKDDALAEILAERNGELLAADFRRRDARWRSSFESFGTCSITEPVDTLAGLGFPTPPTGSPRAASPHSQES